jgi:uncharacterized protein with FMN-binding domain
LPDLGDPLAWPLPGPPYGGRDKKTGGLDHEADPSISNADPSARHRSARLPTIDVAAAGAQTTGTTTAKYAGVTAPAQQWGTVTVNVTVQTMTAGKKVTKKFTDLGGGYTYHTSRSQFIMSQALPILRQEFLSAQSASIHLVSGATLTSEAFVHSLQSALLKARV